MHGENASARQGRTQNGKAAMNKCSLGPDGPWYSTFLAVVMAAYVALPMCIPASASAAERTVLCEEFTDQICGACTFANPAVSRLLDVYSDSVALVQYQMYANESTPWGDARAVF